MVSEIMIYRFSISVAVSAQNVNLITQTTDLFEDFMYKTTKT